MKIDIQRIIKDTCFEMTRQFKLQGLLLNTRISPYQKTEQLLYNYKNFKQVIEEKQNHISFIKEIGVQNKSKDITKFSGNSQFYSTDKAEEQIESLEYSIILTKQYIQIIDDALCKIDNDPYYDLIQLKYFENKTREELAEYFDVDVATVSRNKSRLINKLKIYIFPDEAIADIFK